LAGGRLVQTKLPMPLLGKIGIRNTGPRRWPSSSS